MIPPKRAVIIALSVLLLSFLVGAVLMSLAIIVWQSSSSGGEDSWICSGGQWIMHGKPSAPKPASPCGPVVSASNTFAPSSLVRSPSALSDSAPATGIDRDPFRENNPSDASRSAPADIIQPSTEPSIGSLNPPHFSGDAVPGTISGEMIFQSEDFSMTYPAWKEIEKVALLEPYLTKVSVTSRGCALVLTVRALPQNIEFQSFMEQLLADQASRAQVILFRKDISAVTMHIEGQFPVGSRIAYTDQYGFLTSRKQFYSLVFVAERGVFPDVCAPFVDGVVKSVVVK
ncbi:MAG: hypothetical protein WCG83_06470 [Candidatus Peregrinibacteria bacterium]